MSPIQKILFGSPGTGKSYKVLEIAKNELGISADKFHSNVVKTVFHPEYKYSDFIGKLLPFSSGNSITYKYYPGHFFKALGKAYRSIIDGDWQNYLLVIDEMNRGNAAAIFGGVFQLLDRDDDGWSSYSVDISAMEMVGLLTSMGYKVKVFEDNIYVEKSVFENFIYDKECNLIDKPSPFNSSISLKVISNIKNYQIQIPPNLSIISTINTCDESIYYLDTAFKRRWDWEYIEAPSYENLINKSIPEEIINTLLSMDEYGFTLHWYKIIIGANEFIKSCYKSVRKVEDKQIGWWFIRPQKIWINNESYRHEITIQQVRDKLMFYLWDSVFTKDKKPIVKLLEDELEIGNIKLVTYADFLEYTQELLQYWHYSTPAIEYDEYDSIQNF